jgi:hypothetical protein
MKGKMQTQLQKIKEINKQTRDIKMRNKAKLSKMERYMVTMIQPEWAEDRTPIIWRGYSSSPENAKYTAIGTALRAKAVNSYCVDHKETLIRIKKI